MGAIPGRRRLIVSLAAALLSLVCLCWPALLNGGAFFFPDTSTYLREADAAFAKLTGWQSEWSDRRSLYENLEPARTTAPDPAQAAPAQAGPAQAAQGPVHPALLGRSIYYGIVMLPVMELLGSIGAALLQAAFAVGVIRITLLALGVPRRRIDAALLGTCAALAAFTSLPFFVSMIMPDVFSGFAIALCASAAVGWNRLVRGEQIVLAGLICFSAMVHSSHVLLLLALAAIIAAVQVATRSRHGVAIGLALLAAACGLAGDRLFSHAVAGELGEPPIRPPFLTARLVDDGPGLDLLRRRCPAIDLEACRFIDRMPRDSDTFLWSPDPRDGVFSVESHAVQRRLSSQDMSFAISTFLHSPAGTIAGGLRNALRQLTLFDLNIFNAQPSSPAEGVAPGNLPAAYQREVAGTRYARAEMPVAPSTWLNLVTGIASFLVLAAVCLLRRARWDRIRLALFLFLIAIFINAAVTGSLSKPHDRYNVRITWVLQLAAIAILLTRREKESQETPDARS